MPQETWSIVALSEDLSERGVLESANLIAAALELQGFGARASFASAIRRYPRLRTLLVPKDALTLRSIGLLGQLGIVAISNERISEAPPGPGPVAELTTSARRSAASRIADPLNAIGVLKSRLTGFGQLVMVLDVGFDEKHPDFTKRAAPMTIHPFSGKIFPDTGHGTRSVGLACGPLKPTTGKRYGVAHQAEVFVGLVRDKGGIPDRALLAGIQEAIKLGATVVNLSLGATIELNEPYSSAFEVVAQRALHEGVLLVAAAGNDDGPAEYPVKHPANCPSVLAVGALAGDLSPLPESCVRRNCDGEVDIAAPGFNIRSSTFGYPHYDTQSGTSSASALVAGTAALWAEKGYRGCDLWHALVDHAAVVKHGSRRTSGSGLVQAPRK